MHEAFNCFEWGACEVGRPHPEGFRVHPDGPWSHAVLSLRRTGEEIGDAWYVVEDKVLTVLVQVADDHGGTDDPWLIRLVADTLFGEEGFTCGYYDERATRIRYRNVNTQGVWDGSWTEMRGGKSA